jgi:hypothetical protein
MLKNCKEFKMQAVREIIRADSETVTVKIPEEFRNKDVELILLPFPDIVSKNRKGDKLARFDRMVKNAKKRNLKIDPGIDIDALMGEMNNGLC